MTLPVGAKLQLIIPDANAAVYDVSDLLPRHKTKAYGARDPDLIQHVIVHKSGADGPAGFAGCQGMARFCVDHRGWPGAAYTYWIPRVPDKDSEGRDVVYRCNPDGVRSYHTGGKMNVIGVGICCQGNYDGDWDLVSGIPQIEKRPTDIQFKLLAALIDYLEERHPRFKVGLDHDLNLWGLTGHFEHGKPVCPGDALRQWIELRRGGGIPRPKPPLPASVKPSPKDLQAYLTLLGYDPGPVDGIIGYQTRAALEKFQRDSGLEPDGWYGPRTAAALTQALRMAKT